MKITSLYERAPQMSMKKRYDKQLSQGIDLAMSSLVDVIFDTPTPLRFCVSLHMFCQVSLLSKLVLTYVAGVRFLPCMCSHVSY